MLQVYRILHELSFNINKYETSLGNDNKPAYRKLYNVSWI